jgi:DNA-directed RNA polymerase subunit RPC12/RpoP
MKQCKYCSSKVLVLIKKSIEMYDRDLYQCIRCKMCQISDD